MCYGSLHLASVTTSPSLKYATKPHEAAKRQAGKEFQLIKNNGQISTGLTEHIKASRLDL